MPINFEEIPYDLIIDILSKMGMASLAKMRQTTSRTQAVVEKNRFRIKARSEGIPAILKICVDSEKMALVTKVALKILAEESHAQLSYHLELIPNEEYILIENPVEQLSAVRFDYVHLDFDFQLVGDTAMKMRENMISQAAVAEEALRLLDHLRLDCDWLCLKITRWNIEKTPEILSKIFFKKFFFNGPCTSSDVKQWPTQNCDELHIGNLKDVPNRIAPMINFLTSGSLMIEAEESIGKMVEDFLKEIKEDGSIRGDIKKFSIFSVGVEELDETEDLEIIWDGENECDEDMIIYKMKFDGGVVYLKLWQDSYDIGFTEEECDEEIINDFTCCRCDDPCDYF